MFNKSFTLLIKYTNEDSKEFARLYFQHNSQLFCLRSFEDKGCFERANKFKDNLEEFFK